MMGIMSIRGRDLFVILVLSLILAMGFLVRSRHSKNSGYMGDIALNMKWGKAAARRGIVRSYYKQRGARPNYPPGMIMVFAGAYRAHGFWRDTLGYRKLTYSRFIKFPSILADLFTAIVLFLTLYHLKKPIAAFLSATAYALQPAVIYDSAVWGQNDSIYTLFIVLAVHFLLSERWFLVGIFAAISVFMKAQAVVIFPLLAYIILLNIKAIPRATLGMIMGSALFITPFFAAGRLGLLKNIFINSVGHFSNISQSAYNYWFFFIGGKAFRMADTHRFMHLVSYRTLGVILFFLAIGSAIFTLRRHFKRGNIDPENVWLAGAFCAFAFYMINTEMHERYFFPVLALMLPVVCLRPAYALIYVPLSVGVFMNLLGILPYSNHNRHYMLKGGGVWISAWLNVLSFTALYLTLVGKEVAYWLRARGLTLRGILGIFR